MKRIISRIACIVLVFCMMLGLAPSQVSAASTSQTKHAHIKDSPDARWKQIQRDVFESASGASGGGYSAKETANALDAGTLSVKAGNSYFNWVDNDELEALGVEAWDGTKTEVQPETAQVTYDYTSSYTYYDGSQETTGNHGREVEYIVFNVSTASEFRWVLEYYRSSATAWSGNVLLNLTNDINLNGSEQIWAPINTSSSRGWLYIEGNGHTIYNMRAQDTAYVGLFGYTQSPLIIKNLNFQSTMLIATSKTSSGYSYVGTLYGYSGGSRGINYFYNVHAEEGYVHSEGSYAAGLTGYSHVGSLLVKECSTSDYDICGAAHVAGLCSFTTKYSGYVDTVKVKYDAAFPELPESGNAGDYPIMIEDCYSTGCELLSISSDSHSGGFISCGDYFIIRNCFTDNTMYGTASTGGFAGALPTSTYTYAGYYDDSYNRKISCYLENCYSSGVVEGESGIGGFVGDKQYTSAAGSANKAVVFKNCYSTAMVGGDYAGELVGGFIGRAIPSDITFQIYVEGELKTFTGAAYINCYAAGETGNILTDTENNGGSDYIGGFVGGFSNTYATSLTAFTSAGFYNCYYDKQTTAMRERAIGNVNKLDATNLDTVLTGVYTQASTVKEVQGLAYSSSIASENDSLSVYMDSDEGSSSTWTYTDEHYPELSVFADTETSGFGAIETVSAQTDRLHRSQPIADWYITYDSNGNKVQTKRSLDMQTTAENYSEASVSTVFLNHWDTIMDRKTGAIAEENDWICGLAANRMTYNENSGYWELSYENVAAGTYEFKIQEGSSWSYNYGSDGFNGGNCKLTLDEISDVTIRFQYSGSIADDGGARTTYHIYADITPADSSTTTTVTLGTSDLGDDVAYVVAGTTSLTGYNWDTSACAMTAVGDGTYTYTFTGVKGGANYGYTVVPQGKTRDTGTNHFFYLKESSELTAGGQQGANAASDTYYNVVITYKPADGIDPETTSVAVYAVDDTGMETDLASTCLEEAPRASSTSGDGLIEFYTVAGDEGLTGYTWLGVDGSTDAYIASAVSDGTMKLDETTGIYSKTYYDVPVGTGGETYSYSFKVVANGDWDYGIDYGSNGANYVLQLATETSGVTTCNVTITFDPGTQSVGATTSPDCIVKVDESAFIWYVASEYELVSDNAYTSDVTTYDTVRDITSGFSFTSGTDTTWAVDSERNTVEEFTGQFGGDGFDISYTVDGTTVTGSFKGEVLVVDSQEEDGQTVYSVSEFAPGKSWVQTVCGSTSGDGTEGRRSLRLIPTVYLEAGSNANIAVSENEQDGGTVNTVWVQTSSDRLSFTDIGEQSFSYYNFVLGAGYAATDKVGLGIYDNYENQTMQGYDSAKIRDADETSSQIAGTYFAMYAAFDESDFYTDGSTASSSRSRSGTQSGSGLLDQLSEQSVIGAAYEGAQTIVKVYKGTEESDGTMSYSKVVVDSSSESASAYSINYLKWTGQQAFETSDAGNYRVTFYWLMSDGRYVSDSKYVSITYDSGNLQVSKTVEGSGAESGKSFRFTVTLDDSSVNGIYGGMEFSYGTAEFTLKDGESAAAYGLPEGTAYTVTETGADSYKTTVTGEDGSTAVTEGSGGRAASGTIVTSETKFIYYNNYKEAAPEEGKNGNTANSEDASVKADTESADDTGPADTEADSTLVRGGAETGDTAPYARYAAFILIGGALTVCAVCCKKDLKN